MESRSVFNKFCRLGGLYLGKEKNLVADDPCSCLPGLELRVPGSLWRVQSRSPGPLYLRSGRTTPPPRPAGAPPVEGEGRSGRGPPPRPAEPIGRCDLRRRVTRGGEWAAGRSYSSCLRLPARGSAAWPPHAARPGGRAGRGTPRASARPAMQGPAGNASRGLPGGPPSTVASGAGRCESGALMHSFGIFLQGLLGVVAFSTLMRESRTPTLLRPCTTTVGPAPPQGPSCLQS